MIPNMFRVLLFSVFTLTHAYVFWRISSVPFVIRHASRKTVRIVGLILWVLLFCGLFLGHGGSGPWAAVLELLGMNWLGILLLALVSLLMVEVGTGFGLLFHRITPVLRGWALTVAGILSIVAMVQGARPPVVEDYEVAVSDLPKEMDGMVIVGIADLHLGSLIGKAWLQKRVSEVNAQKPDMVVLLGDILEGHGPSQHLLVPIFRRLSAPLGVWAVPGNHEAYGDYQKALDLMEEAGLQVLCNRWVEIRPGFVVAGVEDLTIVRRRGKVPNQVSRTLEARPEGATVLLSHTPWQIEAAAEAGTDLMLCGHTHGGQIWPFGYLVRLVYPLLAGEYHVDGMTVIVCRGTGTWGPRMRLWHPGEISRVTLRRAIRRANKG